MTDAAGSVSERRSIASRTWVAGLLAVLAAAAAPAALAAVLALAVGRSQAFPVLFLIVAASFVVGLAHAVVLGVPAVWLLRRLGWFRFWAVACAGLVIGMVPMAAWSWPWRPSPYPASAWMNGVQTLDAGVPTLAGWLRYLQGLAYAGAFGAVGAGAFFASFRRLVPANACRRSSGETL